MAEKTDLTENEKLAFYTHLDNITKAQKAYVLSEDWEKSSRWAAYITSVDKMIYWINLTVADKVYQGRGELIQEFIRERGL